MPEQMTKQGAIEYLLYMKHDVQAKSPMDIALDTAIEALKQPTIEPEVRRGRWEGHSSEQIECLESGIYRILSTARCSVCRRWAEHVDDIEKIVTYDVCQNCGARMDERGDDNG